MVEEETALAAVCATNTLAVGETDTAVGTTAAAAGIAACLKARPAGRTALAKSVDLEATREEAVEGLAAWADLQAIQARGSWAERAAAPAGRAAAWAAAAWADRRPS